MIAKITKAYSRTYGDTGQTKVYIEWLDDNGESGRTEGDDWGGDHMAALKRRAEREGVAVLHEQW